jgi:hypothetical protein
MRNPLAAYCTVRATSGQPEVQNISIQLGAEARSEPAGLPDDAFEEVGFVPPSAIYQNDRRQRVQYCSLCELNAARRSIGWLTTVSGRIGCLVTT